MTAHSWVDFEIARTQWAEGHDGYTMKVEYGFHYIQGNSEPYFSITATVWCNGRAYSGGCCHDTIAERLPHLAPLIPFHLWGSATMLPMYYIENGVYWMFEAANVSEYERPTYRDDPMNILKDHLLILPEDGDELPAMLREYQGLESKEAKKIVRYYRRGRFASLIADRAPLLQQRYTEAMRAFGFNKYIGE